MRNIKILPLRFLFLIPFAVLALTSCSQSAPVDSPPGERICTMIGCEDGLMVVLEGRPPGEYRVEAHTTGQPPRVQECPASPGCSEVFFAGFMPQEVTVEVIAEDGATSSRTVRPSYETVQPNGPGCPPTCRQAKVTVPWPGTAG